MPAVTELAGAGLAGLPPGTVAVAAGLAAAWADAVEARTGSRPCVDAAWIERVLLLPLLHGEAVPAASPRHLAGGDAVHCDLAEEDDEERFATAVALAGDGADAERVAAVAQELRLPVTPYRRRCSPTAAAAPPMSPVAGEPTGVVGAARRRALVVVDLTSLWAGPLATRLLASTGAEVVKLEPSCRPDGVRAQARTHAWLSHGKQVVDLDLRRSDDRARFEALVARADVLVSSFSRRVMPNFGYDRATLERLRPGLVTVAVHAFPAARPEADWVAYGGGVHAASGLGDDGSGGWWQPAVSYPDPLAGLAAAAAVERLLAHPAPDAVAGPGPAWPVRHAEITLWDAAAAVAARPTSGR
jgi:hypothetical protein